MGPRGGIWWSSETHRAACNGVPTFPFPAREGAALVTLGILLALPGIYGAGGLIRGMLVGVTRTDPVALTGVAFCLALVTIASCYLPARRALGIDPAQLLRQE